MICIGLGIVLAGLLIWLAVLLFKTEEPKPVETLPETAAPPPKETQPMTTAPETEAPTEPARPEPVRLLFAGDVQLSSHVMGAYGKAGDDISGVVGEAYLERMREADIFMVNEEFPFSDRGAAADKQYTFRSPPERVSLLKDMGIDIVTLANNHALDYGRDALLDTCDTLESAGIRYVGAGSDLERAKKLETIEANGRTIGFLGASRVIPTGSWNAGENTPGMLTTYDPAVLLEEIQKAKEVCDYLVVYVHWGIERNDKPETYQRTMGKQYIDAGADLVIGSHPHVLQGIEYYDGKPIVYSLGNFVFGSSIPKTMLLEAVVDEDQVNLSLIPGTSSAGFTRELTDEGQIAQFYQYIEGISFGIGIDGDGRIIPPQ